MCGVGAFAATIAPMRSVPLPGSLLARQAEWCCRLRQRWHALTWTVFHEFEDAYRARWTVVRMYYEGWHAKSIAGCLKLSERHVRRILAAFEQDGFTGLEDQRSRPPDHPANQLTLPLLKEVLDFQP